MSSNFHGWRRAVLVFVCALCFVAGQSYAANRPCPAQQTAPAKDLPSVQQTSVQAGTASPQLPPLTAPVPPGSAAPDLGAELDALVAYKPLAGPITDPLAAAAMRDLYMAVAAPRKLDLVVRARLDTLLTERKNDLAVSSRKPVTENDPLRWVLVNYESAVLQMTPPSATIAYSNASDFPGAVPAGAQTVSKQVVIDGTTGPAAWRSTGLYAAPGARITLTTDPMLAGKGFAVRIGAHSDSLRNRIHHRYLRMPEISRVFGITGPATTAANAFGGLVYIVVPANAQAGPVTVTIEGAVAAPYYVEGKTTADEWRVIRESPAPWGELEAKNVILTLPSSDLQKVDDPAAIAAFWDKTVASVATLMGRPEGVLSFTGFGASRPERYVADIDISAGGMHAGYPIMTFLSAVPTELDLATFRGERPGGKTWGLLHELGHNYQTQILPGNERFRDWTTDDAAEVTNNMAPLYVAEQMGIRWETANPSLLKSKATALAQIAVGERPWQGKDLFVKLYMYVELSGGLTWKPIHDVFAEYYNAPIADRPKTDQEKRDQWLVRLSKAAGKNLGPFLTRWGYDTSDVARGAVADLPIWLPDEWSTKAAESAGGDTTPRPMN